MSRLQRKFQRRQARREPKLRLLLYCEGKVTEPTYFRDLQRHFRHHLVEIEIASDGGVPKTLVTKAAERWKEAAKKAKRERDDFVRFDEVWCVFDVDEHPHIPEAKQQAHANGIKLAISNPCFELWALLHFQEQNAHIERHETRQKLKQWCPGYRKELPFTLLIERLNEATQRAERLQARHARDDCDGANPSTTVHLLVKRIRGSEQ